MVVEGGEGAGAGAGGEGAGAGGEGEKGWMEVAGFPTDLQSNPTLKKFENAQALGKSYLEMQTLLGGEKIALPKADAPPAEWGRVHDRLGRPEKAVDYGLAKLELPKGLPVNGEVMAEMAEKLHGHGLNTKQAHGVVKDYADILARVNGENVAKQQALADETTKALREKYGATYDDKLHAAGKAVKALLGESETDGKPGLLDRVKLEDGRMLGDHADVLELFMAIGEKMAEDGDLPGKGEAHATLTPDEAKRQLSEMEGDERKMTILTNSSEPEHEALQTLRTALQKQAYPTV